MANSETTVFVVAQPESLAVAGQKIALFPSSPNTAAIRTRLASAVGSQRKINHLSTVDVVSLSCQNRASKRLSLFDEKQAMTMNTDKELNVVVAGWRFENTQQSRDVDTVVVGNAVDWRTLLTDFVQREVNNKTDQLKDGCVAVNFSSSKNLEEDDVKEKASLFVPSVGKVTIAMLQRNLIRLRRYQLEKNGGDIKLGNFHPAFG